MMLFKRIAAIYSLIILMTFSACKNETKNDEPEILVTDSIPPAADTVVQVNLENPVADQKVLLSFKPELGKTYYFTNTTDYNAFSKQDSFEVNAKQSKTAKMKLVVKEITDEKKYKLEFVVTDMRKTIKSDTATLNYQYGKPMADPAADIDRQIEDCYVNSPLSITMNDAGEIVNVEGYQQIIAKMKLILQSATGQMIPEEYIAQQMSLPTENIENFFIVYPDTAVSIGESWDFSAESQLQGMPIRIKSKYTIADRKDGITYINISLTVSLDKSKLPKELVAEMVNLKVTSYMNGVIQVEEKSGVPVHMKMNQFVEISDSYKGVNTYSKETGSTVITSN